MKIEGMPRHVTKHPAGVVISVEPLSDIVPLQKNEETVVTQYIPKDLEDFGLIKIDFLGLRNLTVIRDTENQIRKYKPDFDISEIPEDDSKVYEMISAGKLSGVFQLESQGIKNLVKSLKPRNIENLTAVISLYRPGPMDSIPRYIKNMNNPKDITYKHPILESILNNTYGCILYQEQVMEICRKMAGYSYGHADIVRRAMGKKKHDEMLREKESFISGAVQNGVPKEIAESIFDEVESFASYAFNKSHASSYACLAYQTAYLKCYYFKEYMASLMSSVVSNTSKLMEYISVCRSEGTEIKKPDINISTSGFSVSGDSIYYGLTAIKNVGKGLTDRIVYEREMNGKYQSFQDFCERLTGRDLNKRAVENLIKSGAFDSLDLNRRQMLENYEIIMDSASSDVSSVIDGQLNFLDSQENVKHRLYIKPSEEYSRKVLLKMEKEASGLYLSGNPLEEYEYLRAYLKTKKIYEFNEDKTTFNDGDKVKIICQLQNLKSHITKKGEKMCFITVEDETGEIEATVFSELYKISASKLETDEVIMINGKISFRGERVTIICEAIFSDSDFSRVISGMKLCLKMNYADMACFSKFESIFKESNGNNQVCIYLTDKRKMISPKTPIYVTADEKLYHNLIEHISPDKIGLIK